MDRELWELVNKFFLKSALLVCQSKHYRGQPASENATNTNNWFNIETLGNAVLEREIGPWTSFEGSRTVPPLVIETYLDLTHLSPSQSIILRDQDGNPWNVCKGTRKSEIMLERWLVQLDNDTQTSEGNGNEPHASNEEIYRQLILLFRYLYTLVGLLPANDLHLRLSKPVSASGTASCVNVGTRVLDGTKPIVSKGRIGLSKPLIATYSNVVNETNLPPHLEQRKITPIQTKYGSLRISVSYRRDTDFQVNDNEEYYANEFGSAAATQRQMQTAMPGATNSSLRRVSMNSQRSISVSPNTHISPNLLMDQSPQKPKTALTRQFQPFKAGSVGSGSIPQVIQGNSISRNPSGTSVVAALRAQRSSNGSITTSSNPLQESHPEPSSIGSGSVSKYSSSFGRLRRHSSVRRSDSVERPQKPSKSNESPSSDLLEFMKLLDDRKELKTKANDRAATIDMASSLLKFQGMRNTNNNLSTDLSMSMSLERPPVGQQRSRSRSNSHSPNSSFSPSIQYSSIPMRLSQSRSNSYRKDILDEYSSRRGSADRPGSLSYNLNESMNNAQRTSVRDSAIADDDDDDDLLIGRSTYNNQALSNKNRSTSPGSMRSISSSYNKSQLPFKSVSNFSGPTTMATPAHAKLHKAAAVASTESNDAETEPKKDDSLGHADEDDELLFFMSDMNLSK
ncbi:LAFA_0C00518g1_1 [Lachancea sp. 'fantastica']|nr:LAFA_0C00518g1_1 [Lachancea sp. 'fantastica']